MRDDGFVALDKRHDNLEYEGMDLHHRFPVFGLIGRPCVLRIFLKFITREFVGKLLEDLDPDLLWLEPARDLLLKPTVDMYYEALAITIRIQGIQNRPLWNRTNNHPLRDAIVEARQHFKELKPEIDPMSIKKAQKLLAVGLIQNQYFDQLSLNFQSIVASLGEFVAGDEKLLHFTGNSGDIRLVLSKPDRVGLWFYELATELSNGRSYLLYFRLHSVNKAIGESVPVSEIVAEWSSVVKRLGNPATLLVFDSYYLDSVGRRYLHDNELKYIASVTKERFPLIHDKLKENVKKPGDWDGMHDVATKESAVLYWDPDDRIGMKMVLTNALTKVTRMAINNIIPIYDIYKITFKPCDNFNKCLHDRTWPHRHGSRKIPGDIGLQHNFAVSVTLQNTFNCYCEINGIAPKEREFVELCMELSDALYQYANT